MAIEIKNELRAAAIIAGSAGAPAGGIIQIFGMTFERTGPGVYVFTMDGAGAGAVDPTQVSIYCTPGINELAKPRGRFISPTVLEVRSYTPAGGPVDCVVLFVEVHRYPGSLGAVFPAAPPVPTPGGSGAPALVSWGNSSIQNAADTRFLTPWYSDANARVTRIQYVTPRDGTFENLAILHNNPDGNGEDVIYTLDVNAVPTALTATLASTGSVATNDVDMVAVVKGDLISLSATKPLGIGTSPDDIIATANFAGA